LDCGFCGSTSLQMPKKPSLSKKYVRIFPLIFILGLAYLRYTYIINPNFSGESFFIEINSLQNGILSDSAVNIKSILIYWVLFFLSNIALFSTLIHSHGKVKAVGFLYLLISFASVLLFALDIFWFDSPSLSSMGSILKNFLLSPIFTAIIYILIKYFKWFEKPA
jgi:hypothetical protein